MPEKLFVEMPERNVVSWTTIISGYSKGEMGWKALGLFVLMGLLETYNYNLSIDGAAGHDTMRTAMSGSSFKILISKWTSKTISYMAERVVGQGTFGVVFQRQSV
ncbi:hypothetical protein Droror1_Dr00017036 [Drosera rotundifolia]